MYLHSRLYFPQTQVHPPTSPQPIPLPHPCFHKDVQTPHPPHLRRPLNCLGPPVSSLTELRSGSPLLYMCWRPHISWCMLPGWCYSERSLGSRLIETAVPPTGSPSFSASSNLSLTQPQGVAASSFGWMQIFASDPFSCLLGFSEGSHDRFLFM